MLILFIPTQKMFRSRLIAFVLLGLWKNRNLAFYIIALSFKWKKAKYGELYKPRQLEKKFFP